MTVQTGFGLTAQEYYYYGAGAQDLVPVPDTAIRNLTNFRAVMSSRVELNAALEEGDVVSASFLAPRAAVPVNRYITDGVSPHRLFSILRTDGNIQLGGISSATMDGNAISNLDPYPVDGNLHTLSMTVGTARSLARIGSMINNAEFFDGVIYNVTVERLGVIIHNWRLDDTLLNSNVIRNSAATLGSELIQESNISTGTNWSISNGNLIYSGTGTDFVDITVPGLVTGDTYRSNITATSGTFRDRFDQTNFTGVSASERAFQYSGGTIRIQSNSEPCVIPISQISLREAPGYGTAFGLGAGDSEPYTDLPSEFVQAANAALISSTPVLGDDSAVEFSLPAITIVGGNEYRISAKIDSLLTTPPGGVNIGWENTLGIPFAVPFRLTGSAIAIGALLNGDIVGTGNGTARLFGRDTVQLSYNEISGHRILRKAP